MKLIPQRLKNLFTRKSKKAAQPAPAAFETAVAPEPVIEAPKQPSLQEKRLPRLNAFKSENGVYTLGLDIQRPVSGVMGDKTMVMVNNREADIYLMLVGNSPLAGARHVANAIEEHMIKHFGLDVGKTYFKMKNENFYIDGYDAFTGLPPGGQYQVVLVPEGNNWKPPVMVPPARKALPESSPLLSAPVLPPWLQRKLADANKPKPPQPK
ncbi:MAG TPA: hypothetical protein VEF76_13190 [Patescibacteria group bacterium]|nr:hypothetical protein [Patescibacteria group bacterium]